MIFDIATALDSLRKGTITARELLEQHIDQIEKKDSEIQAYTQTFFDTARIQADTIDRNKDYEKPLSGIPLSLKDVISLKGEKNTAGSRMLEKYIAPYSATIVNRLEEAGAIIIGKVNTDEFTMGSSCETSQIRETKNPWDITTVPGGSSGGSAAAVSAGMGFASIGTDTGGSIRQPANFCGVTGLKVSYGRVSRSGIISYASSFDSIGPLGKTVEDTARVLEVIAGKDEYDATTPDVIVDWYSQNLEVDLRGKKIGYIKEFMEADGLREEIRENVEASLQQLESQGAQIVELSLPLTQYAIPTYYLLAKAEASTNLARYDGVRFGASSDADSLEDLYKKTRSEYFGDEVKRAIMMGTYTLSAGYYDAYYLKAAKVRTLIQQEYIKAFESVDTILSPVSPFPAFKRGEKISDPLEMYSADIFTVTANLAGICSISVPTGLLSNGLPTGVQIMGKPFDEMKILQFGKAVENIYAFSQEQGRMCF